MPARLWRVLPLLIFIGLAVLLWSGLGRDTEELPSALAGKPVPAMTLPSLLRQGETVDESVFQGRWSLLNVWATWCPTCYVEHPYLIELARAGVPIVGLNSRDEDQAALDYLADLGNPYVDVAVDKNGDYGLELGVYGAPETFVINPQGEVVLRHAGDLSPRVWADKIAPVWGGAGSPAGPAIGEQAR